MTHEALSWSARLLCWIVGLFAGWIMILYGQRIDKQKNGNYSDASSALLVVGTMIVVIGAVGTILTIVFRFIG